MPNAEASEHEPSPYVEAVADEDEVAPSPIEEPLLPAIADEVAPAPAQELRPAPAVEAPARAVAAEPAKAPPWLDEPLPDTRRRPLRFMWQMDHEGRFSLGSDEFTRLIGMRTAAGFGRLWSDIADTFGLDPDGRVMKAFATHGTWSGIILNWPVDGGGKLPVELSGLPIFDRMQNFAGYRGFGVCRDLDGLARLAALRRYEFFGGAPVPPPASALPVKPHSPAESDVGSPAPAELPEPIVSETSSQEDLETTVETPTELPEELPEDLSAEAPKNVVQFRPIGESRPPSLTPVENNAFNELARELSARLESETGLLSLASPSITDMIAERSEAHEPAGEAPADEQPRSEKPEWLIEPEPRAARRSQTRSGSARSAARRRADLSARPVALCQPRVPGTDGP